MLSIIIIIFSFILDGILSNFIAFDTFNLSLFTPSLTLVSLVTISILFYHQNNKYLLICFITGIVYDLFYTNLLFFNGLLFLLIGALTLLIEKYLEIDFIKILFLVAISIIIYESSSALIILIYNLVPVTLNRIIYKISHSLLLNIIYGFLLYLIIYLIPKKFKRININ